jgi:DNA processing protein
VTAARLAGGVDRAEVAALLALLAAPRLPQHRVLELLRSYGDARAAFAALGRDCGAEVAQHARGADVRRRVQRALYTIETSDIQVVPHADELYPARLHESLGDAAPPVLFARGDLDVLRRPGIAVVGCRGATEYGLDVAEQIGAGVARAGGCIVSGLARGVDAAAHEAALDAGGTTIAVLGCGVDVYYPQQNMRLQDRIAEAGLLLSEFLPGDSPRKHRFPHRNRIIAALSRAVVVVEAGDRSGALNTAEHAMTMGTPTWGVPNALDRPTMQGIRELYRDGVPPFTGVRDLLETSGVIMVGGGPDLDPPPAPDPPAGDRHARIWAALGSQPAHVDGIAAAARVPASDALATLLELELDGRARQLPGSRFSLPPVSRRRPG